MPRLIHDGAFRSTRGRCAGRVASTQGVPRILGRIETRLLRKLLDHARNIRRRELTRQHSPMAIERAEQRALCYRSLFKPRLQRAHRAGFRIGAIGYADPTALPILVCLTAPQGDGETILAKGAVLNVQSDKLRPAEGSSEAQKD